jgi:UDP-glucose 4-epimerase
VIRSSNPRVLVIGGNGFIGSHVVDALVAAGFGATTLDRAENRFRKPNPRATHLFADWSDTQALEAGLTGVDLVIHLISATLPADSNSLPEFDVRENLLRTLCLLNLCAAKGVRRIIFASSGGTVYGAPHSLPISETHPTNPLNSHGIVKLAIEKYLALYERLHGLEYVSLRMANPYGEWQNPDGLQGIVAVAMGRVARRLPIEIFGDGNAVRDYVYVGDVAHAFVLAAQTTGARRIYNVGSARGLSVRDLLSKIFEVAGHSTAIQYGPTRSADAPANVLDIGLIRSELSWTPSVSLIEGLQRTWSWVKTLPA